MRYILHSTYRGHYAQMALGLLQGEEDISNSNRNVQVHVIHLVIIHFFDQHLSSGINNMSAINNIYLGRGSFTGKSFPFPLLSSLPDSSNSTSHQTYLFLSHPLKIYIVDCSSFQTNKGDCFAVLEHRWRRNPDACGAKVRWRIIRPSPHFLQINGGWNPQTFAIPVCANHPSSGSGCFHYEEFDEEIANGYDG